MSWPIADVRLGGVVGRQLVGGLAQLGGVDLGVLVLAEEVLQLLEPLDERLALRRREQTGEALEQVAQLLGVLAQLVDVLGRRRPA